MIIIMPDGVDIELHNFGEHEFVCPCCGENKMQNLFLWKLQQARSEARIRFDIESGYRCKKHNKEVGGKKASDHLFGEGVDILTRNSSCRWKIIEAGIRVGIKRIGIGETFTHLGTRRQNPQLVMWTYPRKYTALSQK